MTVHGQSAPSPGRYRHYKGKEYTVLGMARHSERTPPAWRAFFQVYQMAGQPPPEFNFFMRC